jgi:hypothetical protein
MVNYVEIFVRLKNELWIAFFKVHGYIDTENKRPEVIISK